MWTRDIVDFTYNNSKVTTSSGDQESGWIFPNIARNKGIKKIISVNAKHQYRAKDVIGAGIPTPWGDLNVYEKTYTHYLTVEKNGAWHAPNK